MSYKVIDRTSDIKELERNVKNKFKWWLEEKDNLRDFMSDYFRKIDIPGYCICEWCRDKISYAARGKADLKPHAAKKKHRNILNARMSTPQLPAVMRATQAMVDGEEDVQQPAAIVPYGAPPNCAQQNGNVNNVQGRLLI
jgi:hypothetical protein